MIMAENTPIDCFQVIFDLVCHSMNNYIPQHIDSPCQARLYSLYNKVVSGQT